MPELTATKAAAADASKRLNRIPQSTYRLQLGAELNLDQVYRLLPYLQQLGISDLYLSPLFRSRAESSHGYDVVDHGTIDPSIGDLASFERLAEAARAAGMGILLDVVPNHMGINDPGNVWWLDVLENGEGSYFADFFDIDWQPAASALQDTVLLPFLAEPFGTVLEKGDLRVVYAEQRLQLSYGPRRFPLAAPTWVEILELAAAEQAAISGGDPAFFSDAAELESIITQLRHLPPGSRRDAESMEERYREQSIARRRLHQLITSSPAVRTALNSALDQINGEKENPRSFDQLERLLERQWYRLAYWRVAADEINYRRFFDINDLAAIRVENPRVFDAVHRLVAHLVGAGWVTGLRIDHPDGLRDPNSYFKNLQSLYRVQQPIGDSDADEIYVVAEKILSGDEPLCSDWAICGTTGYDLMNMISRVQVHGEGLAALASFYQAVTGNTPRPTDVVYESKRAVLSSSLASELQMLTADLYRIAQSHRASRDFTRPALQRALLEVIACMTVYRSYVRSDSWDVSEADYRTVSTAVRMAKRRNRTLPVSVFDYVASVLLLESPPTLTPEQAAERREFVLTFQQVSGPVAAKGVEDTAFYRYYPLASLNEVGGELDARPLAVEEFHRLMRHRIASWPHSLSGTATHDSKRGEDLRARLHVLSEASAEWTDAFQRWRQMNRSLLRELDGDAVPDANEEYLLYQTLVGTWPHKTMTGAEREQYRDRILQYMEKALREAKIHTSWMNPSESYETAVREFIGDLLGEKGKEFVTHLNGFVRQISDSGFVNSLAQMLLKMTLPGVPDFYQGTELWDFNLVDPDNRRPIDFEQRRRALTQVLSDADTEPQAVANRLSQRWPDALVKLWVASRGLALRREWPDVFSCGEYIPLTASGAAAEHVIAFARRLAEKWVVVAVPRHFYRLNKERPADVGQGAPQVDWAETRLILPADSEAAWRCELSGRNLKTIGTDSEPALDVGELFSVFPAALLSSDSQ
ncbi:MAG: malto-oligosyltrehalose synthase [Pirellulales bacterium]